MIRVVLQVERFQSHAGSIEAPQSSRSVCALRLRFNPTLVRLRPDDPSQHIHLNALFQSHAGSIEASSGLLKSSPASQFQSHAGSIEARWRI